MICSLGFPENEGIPCAWNADKRFTDKFFSKVQESNSSWSWGGWSSRGSEDLQEGKNPRTANSNWEA